MTDGTGGAAAMAAPGTGASGAQTGRMPGGGERPPRDNCHWQDHETGMVLDWLATGRFGPAEIAGLICRSRIAVETHVGRLLKDPDRCPEALRGILEKVRARLRPPPAPKPAPEEVRAPHSPLRDREDWALAAGIIQQYRQLSQRLAAVEAKADAMLGRTLGFFALAVLLRPGPVGRRASLELVKELLGPGAARRVAELADRAVEAASEPTLPLGSDDSGLTHAGQGAGDMEEAR